MKRIMLSLLALLAFASPAWAIERNVASQKVTVTAWDTAANAYKTGDAANITVYVSIDGGTVTALADTSASEKSSTNAPGQYAFDLSQAETNGKQLEFSGKSSTGSVIIAPKLITTVPPNMSLTTIDTSGRPTSLVSQGVGPGQLTLNGGTVTAAAPTAASSGLLARQILNGEKTKIVFLGDSVTAGLASTPHQVLSDAGIRGYGFGGRWFDAGTLATVFTGDATVNDFADPLDGGSWMAEVDFGSGTSDASSTSTANRMLRIAQLGPPNGASASGHFQGSTQAQFAFGRDWMADTTTAGRALTVKLPVYETSNGPTNSDMYFVVLNGSTVIATSGFFDGYNATSQWKIVTATIPSSVTSFESGLSLEVRFRASTAAQNGKTAYFSAHGAIVDDTITTGQEVYLFAQGGASVDDYNNTAWWSDAAMSLLATIDPDTISICLGLNDSSSGDAATFSTEIQALVTRLRTYCPDATIVFTSPHAKQALGGNYGGGGPAPYYATGMRLAQAATANSLVVDLSRLLPNAGILSGKYSPNFTSIANGQVIFKGMVVVDAGNYYCSKTDHLKTATVPGSDATNWQSIAATGTIGPNQPRASWLNPILYDGLHPHMPGNFVWMQTWKMGVNLAGATLDAEYYASQVRTELAPELARVDVNFSDLPADVWLESARTITGGTITTYTGNTPQTGDAFARIGAPATTTLSADLGVVGIAVNNALAQATAAAASSSAVQGKLPSGGANMASQTSVDAIAPTGGKRAAGEGATAKNLDQVDAGGGGTLPLTETGLLNFQTFYNNGDAVSAKTINNVTAPKNITITVPQP